MKKQRILSLILAFAMVMSMFTFNISVAAQESATTVDPYDFAAFEDCGVYIYAGNKTTADTESGLYALSYDDTRSYDNRIYHYINDKAYIEETIASDEHLKGAYENLQGLNATEVTHEYITRTADGAWDYRTIGGKDAFWTTRNVRNRSEDYAKTPGGSVYFGISNDVINDGTPNLTFLIEYYDNDQSDVSLQYCNTAFANDGKASVSSFTIDRTGTNTWKTARFQVTDAKMDKDWNKTALANGYGNIKLLGPGTDYYISKILIVPTSAYNNLVNPGGVSEDTVESHNDGINWWKLVKEKGVYVEASDPTANMGMSAYTANKLYNLNNASDVAAIGSQTINGKTVDEIKAAGYAYATLGKQDNAMNISSATSADGVTKDTFFTVKNYRDSTSFNVSGNMYFAVTSDKITSDDDDVYVVIEYLDYDPNMSTTQNSNGTYSYKNQTSFSPTFATNPAGGNVDCTGYPSFNRHNTNTWRTVAIPVSDAELTNSNTKTGLVDDKHDIKFTVNGVPTHVSRVGVVKASDVGIGTHKYYAPENPGDGPAIWLAGDSIVEQLDVVGAYPRTGWGMELGNFFKKETISNASEYTYDANDYMVTTQKSEGVTIVNRAKGGKSTRTFLNQVDPTAGATATDTRWNDVKNGAKKGDYLFVSFCINDVGNRTTVQTNPYLVGDPGDRFSHRANIAEFKNECDKLGINLVLVTPASGRGMGAGQDAHIASLHAQGRELGVPVIDVRTYHKALIQELKDSNDLSVYSTDKTKLIFNHILDANINKEYTTSLGTADDTHINQTGAREICKIIIQEIQRKSNTFESMNALSKWIDTSVDTTTMAAPAHQDAKIKYEIENCKYIVDGAQADDYRKGEVAFTAKINNMGTEANDAVIYLVLYNPNGTISKMVKSNTAQIASGAASVITTPSITVPDLEGYKLRKYVWNSKLKPYDVNGNAITLYADGANRRANLEWTLSKEAGDVTFDIYRDDLLIASTKNGAYVDEGVERGEHKYQINVVKNGEVIDQSAYALATVTNLYESKLDGVYYTKAYINSMNNVANINNCIKVVESHVPYYPQDAVAGLGLTADDIAASYGTTEHKFQGAPLVTNGGDASHRTEYVTDKYGVTKAAWMVASMYRPGRKEATQAYLYIDETSPAHLTTNHTTMSVFVEFLGNKKAPAISYWAKFDDGTTGLKNIDATAYSGNTTGDWRIARYDIKDAYFEETTKLQDNSFMRIASGWGTPLYISSIAVIRGDVASAISKYTKLNNLEFNERDVRHGADKYPNGVSADFSSGKAVLDGMDVAYSTGGTSDNTAEIAKALDGVGYFGTKQVIYNNALKGTYLYFKLDRDYVFGSGDKLVVDMTYKADYNTTASVTMPSYDKQSGVASTGNTTIATVKLNKNTNDNWQDVQFVIDNPSVLCLDNNGAAFRMSIPQSADDANMQLRISKIRVRTLNGKNVAVENNQTESAGHTLHIAADSIAAYYSPDRVAANGITGWGMTIGDYLTDDITINNRATAGASTVTFGNMPSILSKCKQGDYVLMSFGHNDQMSNKWVSIEDYKANLTNWINQIRDKKAVPVLVTMIPQGQASTGTFVASTSFDDRRAAVAQVAASEDVMLVKLGETMIADYNAGKLTAAQIVSMYCDEGYDNRTHVTESGARYISQIIVNSMKSQSPYFAQYVK